MAKDYIPSGDAQFNLWLDNFVAKLANHAGTIGITNEQMTQFQTDFQNMKQVLSDVEAAKATLESTVQRKNDLRAVVEKRVRDSVIVLKRHAGYKAEIGSDLAIITGSSGDNATVIANAKPRFEATTMPDQVRLDWLKKSFDGIRAYCKRGEETAFTLLDKDLRSPFEDKRPNLVAGVPEYRTYRMRYIIGDNEVGQWSDEVRVLVLL